MYAVCLCVCVCVLYKFEVWNCVQSCSTHELFKKVYTCNTFFCDNGIVCIMHLFTNAHCTDLGCDIKM